MQKKNIKCVNIISWYFILHIKYFFSENTYKFYYLK